ncbi:Lactoylglutathione lyase [Candida viswanathii]|uniref:Lactoylglutathione lyase n=1 Tax=Candida viswanathii TaxID=5486 RepID=A0A367Y3B2_9ASCO|nr:Lactoylglutathione lyase [Candida viswanathii]
MFRRFFSSSSSNLFKMATFNNSFLMNHTCLRIKDPKVSVPFYTEKFGMKLIATFPFKDFTLYMLNYETEANKNLNWSAREGVLELCHNHGVENDPDYKLNNGNGDKDRGFGHICVSVDNIQAFQDQLLSKDVKFQKKLTDGRQKNIAFALDPNGYWIELIENGIDKVEAKTNSSSYKLNHTMIRVKDPKKSLEFYRDILGFKLLSTKEFPEAKFTLYFLGYEHDPSFKQDSLDSNDQAKREGIIELTHNWGTESDPEFKGYHNGNSTENGAIQGYGHTCVSCEDPAKFCQELTDKFGDKLDWSLKWDQGNIKKIAFIRDPDGYSIEILGHDLFADKQANL